MKGSPYIYIAVLILCAIAVYVLIKNNESPIKHELYKIPFHIDQKSNDAPRVVSDVPLTVYQSWHSNEVPTKMHETIYSLLEMNPEFDYYLYSDDACRKFIQDNFNIDVLKAFDSLKPGAYKSDLWRYCILYRLGGVYLDIKFASTVPLINIIETNPIIFVRDKSGSCTRGINTGVYNAFMVSPPNNPIFKSCIDDIVNSCNLKLYKTSPIDITGPCLLSRIIQTEFLSYNIDTFKFKFSGGGISGFMTDKIYYNDTVIFNAYSEYRREQKLFQSTEHYDTLWRRGKVYN